MLDCNAGETDDSVKRDEIMFVHVMTKNLQSIREENRFNDFVADFDHTDFDMIFLTET